MKNIDRRNVQGFSFAVSRTLAYIGGQVEGRNGVPSHENNADVDGSAGLAEVELRLGHGEFNFFFAPFRFLFLEFGQGDIW